MNNKKLIMLLFVLIGGISFSNAAYKPSTLFSEQYNADETMDPLDGPYTNNTIVRWNNAASHSVNGGIAYWSNTAECSGVFVRHALGLNAEIFDINVGFTIELKISVSSMNCDPQTAKWGFMLETEDNGLRLDLRAYEDKVTLNGTEVAVIGSNSFDVYDWHIVRISYAPGDTEYLVWIDNVLLGGFGAVQGSPLNRFYFGDLGGAQEGMIKLDYVRIDRTGSYTPMEINIEQTNGSTVIGESGDNSTDEYTILLSENPPAEFTVICLPDSDTISLNGQAGGSAYMAHFQPTINGSVPLPQTIQVSAVYNGIQEGWRHGHSISHLTASSEASLNDILLEDVNVAIRPDLWCGQPGTAYKLTDINKDCKINLDDLAELAADWLICTDPADPSCDVVMDSVAISNPFGTIYNYDGDFSFSSYDPNLSEVGIHMLIDALAGTSVKSIAYSIASGSDILNYPTSISSTWGWRVTPDETSEGELTNIGIRVAKGRACIQQEMDAIRVAGERAKQNGMFFFPSLRVNDYHFVSDPFNSFLTGEFWIQNYETLTIDASGGQSPILGKPDCVNLFDFTYPQVRQFRLDLINEVIDRNEDIIDGFELDFTRSFVFFPKDQAADKAHLLTDFVSAVRTKLTQLEIEYDRDYYLIVRVPPTIEKCMFAGIDIQTWIQFGLVDVIVPSELMTTYFEMPIQEFVTLVDSNGGNCLVFGGFYSRVGYEWPFVKAPAISSYSTAPSVAINNEMTRAAAAAYWCQGADGLYCYNFGLPRTDAEIKRLRDIESTNTLIGENKVYPVTKSFWLDYEDTFLPPKQLPADISLNTTLQFEIQVAEELNPRVTRNELDYCGIRLGFRDINASDVMELKINDQIIHSADLSANLVDVTYADFNTGSYAPIPRMFWQKEIVDTEILNIGGNTVEITFTSLSDANAILSDINIGFIYASKSTAGLYVDE